MAWKNVSDSIASVFKFALLKGHHRWLFLVLWLVLITPAQAATRLRVAIKKDVSQIKVGSSTTALVKDGAGRKLGEIIGMAAFSVQPNHSSVSLEQWKASQLLIEPTENGYVWIGDRWYRGRIQLVRQGKGVTAVNQLDLEQYLYSVVGAEAFPTWPQEALKAQAVAARTYALHQSTASGSKLYDVDTTTQTQVYKGLESEYLSTHEAVNATQGQVLTYNGKAILAVFHSSSGGHTENVEDVWSSRLPYLRGVIDYDHEAPVFQWTKTFSAGQLGSLINGVGGVKSMIPERTTPRGRIITMKVVGDRSTKRLNGTQLRQVLELKSTLFTVTADSGTFQVDGRGYGHGIGLSQWGTYSLAQQGTKYQQILAHYYQNARLTRQ